MPWAERSMANFLDDDIRRVVREVLENAQTTGALIERNRLFSNLLSSQPMAFNLFAHLQLDHTLATRVFRRMCPGRIDSVSAVEFEYSPGRSSDRYTGDRSAFDVYVRYRTPSGGRGFVGIEVKYHENLAGKTARHRARYEEVAEMMECFQQDALTQLRKQPLQQIWRDHLLAGAHRIVDEFDDGFFAFLYPEGNDACQRGVLSYSRCLSDEATFTAWTLEQVVAAIRAEGEYAWVDRFTERYLPCQ